MEKLADKQRYKYQEINLFNFDRRGFYFKYFIKPMSPFTDYKKINQKDKIIYEINVRKKMKILKNFIFIKLLKPIIILLSYESKKTSRKI